MKFVDIIFVDDVHSNRLIVKKNLENRFSVETFESATQLMEALKSFTPRVLILDWMMPETTGLEVLKTLRAKSEFQDLIIIMLTARSNKSDLVTCLAEGANDYIIKPPHYPELIARIESHMRQKKAEENLRMRQQLHSYETLLSGLTHEFNNIFGTFRLFLQMVDLNGPEYMHRKIPEIQEFIQRGIGLVRGLKEFSSLDVKHMEEISLSSTVLKAIQDFNSVYGFKSDKSPVILESFQRDCQIMGSQAHILQALQNLLSNAFHAISEKEGGTIRVSLGGDSDIFDLFIEDNGIGIPPENLKNLGELFFTTKGSFGGKIYDLKKSGTGLGIPTANKIFTAHRSAMHIKSVLGQGTQVQIRFPKYGTSPRILGILN